MKTSLILFIALILSGSLLWGINEGRGNCPITEIVDDNIKLSKFSKKSKPQYDGYYQYYRKHKN